MAGKKGKSGRWKKYRPWESKTVETPGETKGVLDTGRLRFKQGGNGWQDERYEGRRVPTKVTVDEPLAKLLDNILEREAVSERRITGALGLGAERIKDLRIRKSAWKLLDQVRAILWLLGYDLEFRVVKHLHPQDRLILTKKERELRILKKISGGRTDDWDRKNMWKNLGWDDLGPLDKK